MTILINNEKVDFSLENEKNLNDIVTGIEKWLNNEKFWLTAIFVDSKELYLTDRNSWKDIKTTDFEELSLFAGDKEEMQFRDLQTINDYFSMMLEAVKSNNKELLSELKVEYDYIKQPLPNILDIDKTMIDEGLYTIIENSSLLKNEWDGKDKDKILDAISNILRIISGRIEEKERPLETLIKTVNLLKKLEPETAEVSVMLQTGKEQEAHRIVIRLMDLLSKMLRIIAYIESMNKEENLFMELANSLREVLEELEESFKSNDTIEIGDLLEYEIPPILEEIPLLMEKIPK